MAVAYKGDEPPQLRVVESSRVAVETPAEKLKRVNGVLPQVRCPYCTGNIYAEAGALSCMMCSRTLYISEISDDGKIVALSDRFARLQRAVVPQRESRRGQRGSKWIRPDDQGVTGLAARILTAIPPRPGYVGTSALAKTLNLRKSDVRDVLTELEEKGFVERYAYKQGYRTGWRRLEE